MATDERFDLVAPCGTNCSVCGAYLVKDDPALGERIRQSVGWNGSPCPGCRPSGGRCQWIDGQCSLYACVERKKVAYCFECDEFPCAKLNPAVDRANVYPHNLKLMNLCCIERHGVAELLRRTPEIRRRYYEGRLVVGNGPCLPD